MKSLESKVQVIKIVTKAVTRYEYRNHCKERKKTKEKKFNSMKRDISFQNAVDLMYFTANIQHRIMTHQKS